MFFNDTATTEIYTLPLHDALTILGERALPLAWRGKKTHGAIGFREQRAALATVAALLPEGVRPTLMGDRFYGSPAVIARCRHDGRGVPVRCQQDLRGFHNLGGATVARGFPRGALPIGG